MGQKVNPISNRLGFIRGWDSNWIALDKETFAKYVLEDEKIRTYLRKRLAKADISRIFIERNNKVLTITINTARPGMIIGKGGKEVEKLREELKKLLGIKPNKDEDELQIQVNISEVKRPELDAIIVANNIARQIENRVAYRRAVKTAIANTMRMGAKGIKVRVSGRLNGAEMARSEEYKEGRIPLHTFRADIDYALAEAHTKQGRIGVKVWIFKGEVYGKRSLLPQLETAKKTTKGAATVKAATKAPRTGRGSRGRRPRRSK